MRICRSPRSEGQGASGAQRNAQWRHETASRGRPVGHAAPRLVLDLAIIVVYLIVIAAIGLRISGRQRSATDYFVGERNLSWWAVCFSIVATETSTLTV